MTHEEAIELAGLFVLDALTPDERFEVEAHLRTCPLAHPEFAEVGAVAPALADLAAPVSAPDELKSRVLAAYRSEVGAAQPQAEPPQIEPRAAAPVAVARPTPAQVMPKPSVPAAPAVPPRWHMPAWAGWATAVAAVLVIAVVGVWAIGQKSQVDEATQRAQTLSQAVAAMSAPGSEVAILRGTGPAENARGFAAFPQSGGGYVVLTGLDPAPSGKTYQAWYIVDGTPQSAGVMAVGEDGELIASGMTPMAGTDVVAFTVEPAGGSNHPTSAPIITGNINNGETPSS
jgi:hypothetical protein